MSVVLRLRNLGLDKDTVFDFVCNTDVLVWVPPNQSLSEVRTGILSERMERMGQGKRKCQDMGFNFFSQKCENLFFISVLLKYN